MPIQQQEYSLWGSIPGELNFRWSRIYNLYSLDYAATPGAAEIHMSRSNNLEYDVTRENTNATWYPQKSVVQYNQTYEEELLSTTSGKLSEQSILTVNMAAYDTWQQMVNKPKWF